MHWLVQDFIVIQNPRGMSMLIIVNEVRYLWIQEGKQKAVTTMHDTW